MAFIVDNGYPIFTDVDGEPLDEGYIYIGEENKNPLTNPQAVYWDVNLTLPAAQVRTTGGYASFMGSPGRLYTSSPHSLLVLNKNGETVYYQPQVTVGRPTTVEFTGFAGETLTALDLVYRGVSDGKFYKADSTDIYKSVVSGFVAADATIGSVVAIVTNRGQISGFTGLTVGKDYYLSTSGAYTDFASLTVTNNIVRVGRAISTTEMEVAIEAPKLYRDTDVYDISAANKTSGTIPLAANSTGRIIRQSWKGGNGTYTFTLTPTSAENFYMPDGTALTATQVAGYGKGSIEIESDGTQWNVIAFNDLFEPADSGINTSRRITRYLDGTGKATGIAVPGSHNINTASGALYSGMGQSITIGYTASEIVRGVSVTVRDATFGTWNYSPTTTGFSYAPWYTAPVTNRTETYDYSCDFMWYTPI